jgi:hypothetical protein
MVSSESARRLGLLRCEGITASGERCKCYAVQRVNEIPYCHQHAEAELRALAGNTAAPTVGPGEGGEHES